MMLTAGNKRLLVDVSERLSGNAAAPPRSQGIKELLSSTFSDKKFLERQFNRGQDEDEKHKIVFYFAFFLNEIFFADCKTPPSL